MRFILLVANVCVMVLVVLVVLVDGFAEEYSDKFFVLVFLVMLVGLMNIILNVKNREKRDDNSARK